VPADFAANEREQQIEDLVGWELGKSQRPSEARPTVFTQFESRRARFPDDSTAYRDRDGLIEDFNRPGLFEDFAGDLDGFTLTQTPGYELYPGHSLFAQSTISAIAGTTDRYATPFDGWRYGCWVHFTHSNEGEDFRGSWLLGVQAPSDPLHHTPRIVLAHDHLTIYEDSPEVQASTYHGDTGLEAATTYEAVVEFPADSEDIRFKLHKPTPGRPLVTEFTRTCQNRAALEGGTMGFHIGRIGTPLYFDRIWREPL
jgi:hypothetical protein